MTRTRKDELHVFFSDMHKDVHGFRPRNCAGWTEEDFEAAIDGLQFAMEAEWARECEEAEFEAEFRASEARWEEFTSTEGLFDDV